MATKISKRDKLLTIQYPSNGARDAAGHKERIWTTHGNAWVALKMLSGGEQSDGDQTTNFSVFELKMLAVDAPDILASWRFRSGSSEPYTYYNIVSLNTDDRAEYIATVSRDDRPLVDAGTIEI